MKYLGGAESAPFITRIYFIQDGSPVTYPLMHHYDLPDIIYDYVTDGEYCKKYRCAFRGSARSKQEMRQEYLRYMAESIKTR